MTNRWWPRVTGGVAALSLCAALVLTITGSGILNGKRHVVLAAACPHSCNCSAGQVCCSTANGGCGCFPGSIKC
jgi:hypothetical protein